MANYTNQSSPNRVTKIETLMDLDQIFGSDKDYTPQSLDGMPPNSNYHSFEQKMNVENEERHTQMSGPIQGKIRKNVNMAKALNAGNSGSIYPSVPQMYQPPEVTSFSEMNVPRNVPDSDAMNYEFGPRVLKQRRPGLNSYGTLPNHFVEGYNSHNYDDNISCIQIANHIKSCPICSKFYDNDKSMYIIAIVILIILCIVLIKKVLENYER